MSHHTHLLSFHLPVFLSRIWRRRLRAWRFWPRLLLDLCTGRPIRMQCWLQQLSTVLPPQGILAPSSQILRTPRRLLVVPQTLLGGELQSVPSGWNPERLTSIIPRVNPRHPPLTHSPGGVNVSVITRQLRRCRSGFELARVGRPK